ncbi:MAG: hypothetical protein H7833_00425 [Magnetococcus sp. DMHC-1]
MSRKSLSDFAAKVLPADTGGITARWAKRVIVLVLVAGIGGWHWHAQHLEASRQAWESAQPITAQQIAELTALAEQVAQKDDVTRQKVWEDVKKPLGVRQISLIKRGEFDKVKTQLLNRMR